MSVTISFFQALGVYRLHWSRIEGEKMRRAFPSLLGASLLFAGMTAVASANHAPDCFSHHPTIAGTSGSDLLEGTSGVDVIAGLGGNDRIKGRRGPDYLCGNEGGDEITVSAGR